MQISIGDTVYLKNVISWLGTGLVAILPKCPFCYVTYTTSIAVCGIAAEPATTVLESNFILGAGALTVIVLIFSYRGFKTVVSMLLVTIGTLLFAYVPTATEQPAIYVLVSLTMLGGVILNKKSFHRKSRNKDCGKCRPQNA